MGLSNYTPGFVAEYDAERRMAKVRIPGLTDGSRELPEAMLSYPLGDRSELTEIALQEGDRVWLDFVNGDPRFPIITGFRPKETDNAVDWRRWRAVNVELRADVDMRIVATDGKVFISAGGEAELVASSVVVRASSITLEGNVTITGSLAVQGGAAITGTLTNNGAPVGSTHRHGGVQTGGGQTGTPV
jgi:hypothetical protein